MSGFKEANTALAIRIQPVSGTYNEPTSADLMAMYSPDNGSDSVSADDATITGALWAAPRQFLGRKGKAGATFALRGAGGSVPPGAGLWVPGRILQAVGFTEIVNPTAITAAITGGSTTTLQLDAAASSVDDFYNGFPIQHAAIGTGRARGTAIVRDYIGATKTAVLTETLAAAATTGNYTIPPFLGYLLSTGAGIPLLSAKIWRAKKAYRYRDCAVSSFSITIPTNNDNTTDVPTIQFALVGVPVQSTDEAAPVLPSSLLTPTPPAKAGKFVFNGVKIGHQSLKFDFALTTGAPPNVNFDAGQEGYEILTGTRTVNVDLNEQLVGTLDIDGLTDSQVALPIMEGWGANAGQSWVTGVLNAYLDSFSPAARNGFIGVTGAATPVDVDRAIALSCLY